MSETANATETRQQEDTIALEHSGFTIQASMAEAGKAVDLGVGVEEYVAYDEDEDEDHEPNGDDLDQDEEDDLDDDDLEEDEGEEEEEDEDDDDLGR